MSLVQAFLCDDDVFEVALEPDVEIETFFVTENDAAALLTKGKKGIRNRRGGMKKPEAAPGEDVLADFQFSFCFD